MAWRNAVWRDSVDRFVAELVARSGQRSVSSSGRLPDVDLGGRQLPEAYRYLLEVSPEEGLYACGSESQEIDIHNGYASHDFVKSLAVDVLFKDPLKGGPSSLEFDEFWFMGHAFGHTTVLCGDGPDPGVMLPRTHCEHCDYGALFSLRLSRWLDGLFLPAGLGEWRDYDVRPPSNSVNTTNFVASFESVDPLEYRNRVDEILDSLLGVKLPPRGARVVSKSGVLPDDAEPGWLGTPRCTIGAVSMRTRADVLLLAVFGAAALDVLGSGHVRDGLGVFGEGVGVELSGAEAVGALSKFATEGDYDDLCLEYREHLVGLNQLHGLWPVTR